MSFRLSPEQKIATGRTMLLAYGGLALANMAVHGNFSAPEALAYFEQSNPINLVADAGGMMGLGLVVTGLVERSNRAQASKWFRRLS